ncbi:MAG: tagatose-bisphosphate aldolase [Candidatus Yonathbacteria bacterium CG_4_10_14_3_um_filter_47_65]|uniref:Tagatose-bisphosphate aldolase n=2 Tax=Parcubacteria group TaxID=1794811 RepID=A0A2M8D924_9BACT|nr:MAG: tagatose-bisphosphate aldolase [Candidatus Nomurabacteria bacterium CG1_02_47_685]PIP03912.1 MAG: tagatose-bisphosphate aldolase [Candidatus Yonathbacteria bacterium CG23_combo_of_CG06-09_8_20_14_all_46_18]PIQ31179.1 MAG: tagatose-bisphosphate aldolase [Candidatus Yonathbacteria bacterium CG17_big_fil_post_rev_8_21_14_2_50_46_19]PIX56395.1 MAG: tagatose-bisphosphate aldolase [Candidatus Yonathbacteria bacterium CG_4_10_14_3_um_filter_47_65]PIY58016.1 MAG: tagatose-bisphosphate aldolase 
MKNLKETIAEAREKGVSVGHFNISNIEGLWGIFSAARELGVPVIIGVSEGERDFVGVRQTVALVKSLREEFDYPLFANADHSYSFERVKEAIDAGFDAVIFDGAKLPIEENARITKQCVEYARATNSGVLVEAELGYIGMSSKMLDSLPDGVGTDPAMLTKPEDAKRFVEDTGIDFFAPSVGNIHGMLKNVPNPELDLERISAIKDAAGVPLVLHGGSGISDENFRQAIKAGISIIHINTEIRVAYRDALRDFIVGNPDEIAPYRIMKPSVEAVKSVVLKRLQLFSGM